MEFRLNNKSNQYLQSNLKIKYLSKYKHAQITIFIIIAVILLIILGIFIFLKNYNKETKPMAVPIENYVQSCIEKTIDEGITFIGFQGGYYAPKNSVNYLLMDVPYYFYLGKKNIPSKKTIENEFSKYIENELPNCINNFDEFKEQGYNFNFKDINVKTSLGEIISVKINYPLSITKAQTTIYLKNFKYEKEFNFNRLYYIITKFAEEHQKNPDYVPIGYLSLLAEEENFKFELIYLSENEVVYSFIFDELFDRTLMFNFAGKYQWNLTIPEEKIKIKPIPRQTAYEGVEFYYKVELEKGNDIRFTDYTELFDINEKTGEIKFIPKGKDSGLNEILIKVSDNKGNEDSYIMMLDIEKNLRGFEFENEK